MNLSALYQIFLDCQLVTTDSRNCPSKDMDKLMQRRETKETDQNKNKEDGK